MIKWEINFTETVVRMNVLEKELRRIIKAMKWKKLDLDNNLEPFHRNKSSAKGRENRVRISFLF